VSGPSPEKVQAIKAALPGRSLHEVAIVDGETEHVFVMTGPNREEFKKFVRETAEARDNTEKLREAIERAVLGQVRWPERDEVKALFDAHPVFPDKLGEKLHEFAGANAEVRAKNL
jgi:hypothetical protein